MNTSTYIPIIVVIIILYVFLHNQRTVVVRDIIKKRKKESKTEMIELAKLFIDKDCIIYAFDTSHQFTGVIKQVTDGAILIDNDGKMEAINLDFVIRIREYPRNKKGKKVSLILD